MSSFDSAPEELERLIRLLDQEKECERKEFREEWLNLPLGKRVNLGITLHPASLEDQELTVGELWKLTFEYKNSGGIYHKFSSGQVVEIFNEDERLSGVLSWMGEKQFRVLLSEVPDWLTEGKPGMDLGFNETTYLQMNAAVTRMAAEKKSDLSHIRDLLLGYQSPSELPDPGHGPEPRENLNVSQKAAVKGVLNTEDFALIHGPPGTGKTTTLVEAISLLASQGNSLLVTSGTNAAVDLLAEKLLDQGLDILRLGHPGRVNDEVLRHTLEGKLERHPDFKTIRKYRREAQEIYQKARKFKRNFGPAERAERRSLHQEARELRKTVRNMEDGITKLILEKSRIVLCTLVGSAGSLLRDRSFNVCVIDEAAQAIEGAAWIPIQKAPKVIMAGDHCQLPPTIKSNAKELAHTLFEKAITRGLDDSRTFFLDTQYRMEEEIMFYSNEVFYDGNLKADASIKSRPPLTIPEFTSPLIFIDTAGCDYLDEQDPETLSTRNREEAALLVRLLAILKPTILKENKNVGVIAPYSSQVKLLRHLLAEEKATADFPLEIDTVDSFQGRERDIIIISLTRSNDDAEVGFLADTRRMNVAMTRARQALFLLGDSATLASHPFYEKFLETAQSLGDYRSAYEFME